MKSRLLLSAGVVLLVGCTPVDDPQDLGPRVCPPVAKSVSLELIDATTGQLLPEAPGYKIWSAPARLRLDSDGVAGPVACSASQLEAVKFSVYGPFASADLANLSGSKGTPLLEQTDDQKPFTVFWDVNGPANTSVWYLVQASPNSSESDYRSTRFTLLVRF